MKPRVFVSSTYYDLKYVRENILRFIEERYDFDAVLFERGNVPYEHEKSISESCYAEVDRCNMMILIIGGKYGTIDDDSTDPFISITRNEFKTAIRKNIPIFIFVDKNVYLEHKIYKNNINEKYNPVFVDSIKIFDFIDELNGQPITPFEKMEDIELYLSEQWGGWFYNYLDSLGKNSYEDLNDKLSSTLEVVEKLKSTIDAMANETLKKEQIKKIRDNEIKIDIQYYSTKALYCIVFDKFILDGENTAHSFSELFFNILYDNQVIQAFQNTQKNKFDYFEDLIMKFNLELEKICNSIVIKTIDFTKLYQDNESVIKSIKENDNSAFFINCLSKEIEKLGE